MCSIAFMASGMAQQRMQNAGDNMQKTVFFKEFNTESVLSQKSVIEKRLQTLDKPLTFNLPTQNNSLLSTEKAFKGTDWYVIDTMYTSWKVPDGPKYSELRTIFSFTENGDNRFILNQLFYNNQWNNYYTETFEYNADNQLTYYFSQLWNDELKRWENQYRRSITYDTQGNYIRNILEVCEPSQWRKIEETDRTYDAQTNLILFEEINYWRWCAELEEWVNFWEKDDYTYNSQNNLENFTIQFSDSYNYNCDGFSKPQYSYLKYTIYYHQEENMKEETLQVIPWNNSELVNNYRLWSTYDTRQNITEEILQLWSGEWRNYQRNSYEYDMQNNLLEDTLQYWKSGKWENSQIVGYTYDNFNNLSIKTIKNWESGEWVNDSKWSRTYITQTLWSEDVWQNWESGQWVDISRYTYTYNERYILEGFLGWENGRYYLQVIYEYDPHDNLLAEIHKKPESGDWVNSEKYSYSYDENDNATSGIYEKWLYGTWIGSCAGHKEAENLNMFYNNMKSSMGFLVDGYSCISSFRTSYKLAHPLPVQEYPLKNDIYLFPNPVSEILYIETTEDNNIPKVKIYSIQGVLLINTTGKQIDLTSLSSGLYIVNINGINKKIVKQ